MKKTLAVCLLLMMLFSSLKMSEEESTLACRDPKGRKEKNEAHFLSKTLFTSLSTFDRVARIQRV
jgi:hypothetical protein